LLAYLTVIVIGVLILTLTGVAMAANGNQSLFLPGDKPFGKSFVDWAKEWWKWNFSLDNSTHPILDPNPEKCANQNQSANVWFLPTPTEKVLQFTFTCAVPQGKAIMIAPLVTGESDSGIAGSDSEIKDGATRGQIGASLNVWVDHVNQNYNLTKMRATSDFFNLHFVKNNIAGDAPEGTFRAMVDGYYIFLKPLPQGKHELKYEARVSNNPDPSFNNRQVGTWEFNVK
jgi:hypothetical protein